MKTTHKLFIATLLTLNAASLSADRDFIFGEDPRQQNVSLQKIAEIPYRLLSGKDPQGRSIELDDGSLWLVVGSDGIREVNEWRANDPIIIFPCLFPTWTGTRFYVYNERRKTTANVELSFGPTAGAPTNSVIADINYTYGQILLADGMGHTAQWQVSRDSLKTLRNWKLSQSIIIGFMERSYASWFSNESYILINVERNEFVEANLR